MVSYTAKAESTADTLGKAYYATARYLQGKANDVFNAFTDKFELSIAEAETMLKNAPNKSMFEQIKTALATCTDEQKKQQLETLLSSPAYAHRIGRLNDLDSKISDMCSRLANAEIGVDTAHLGDIIQSAYMQTVFDVTKGADYRAAFDLIPESRVKAILSTNWSGQMFSQRVWDNTNALADGLKHDMLVGIMAGKSERHMADDIMNRCGVGAFEARRLVQTETTCVANTAELGYDTVLISQYGGCSETCEPYQGKVYIDDVFTIWNGEKSGDFGKSNYCDKWFMLLSVAIRGGLFHPNCRHTMGQYIDGLTKIPKPIPAEKIREQRELEEKQRAMERSIRALKRKAEGTQDEKKVKEYKRKLREEQGKLREFIKEHDDVLRRDYSREKIYSGEGKPKQAAPRTEEAPVKVTDTESKNPVPIDKVPYVSKPDNNENTMNFVQPEPVKTVQSNEETDNTPTAVVSDEADETAETTENVQETVKQPVEATADSEEDVQNFTDDAIDNSDESDIIEEETDFEPLPADTVVPVLREDSNEWINRLSSEEVRAIKKYTKNSGDPKDDKFYARLNSMLRGDIPEDDTLKYYSDVISGAIAKFELKHDIICYRSVKHNPVEGMKVGDIYEPKQFVSTAVSISGVIKGDYFLTFLVPKGSKGAYIELLSKYPKQRELLFDKNLKYQILEIRGNEITLEVII